ncbi:MAG TPA: lysylphosphatidylglycerol synthase transmembrane domain-containing protein [Burkholderiales bacterium]
MKRLAGTALRAAVSLAILAFVLSRVSLDALFARARGAAWPELALVGGLFVAMALLVALRWRLLAGWLGLALPGRLTVRAVFVGLFAGQMLPSSIGSDVVRGWMVARQTGRAGLVAASLVADRLIGFCGVSLLLALAYGFFVHEDEALPGIVVASAALGATLAVLALLAGAAGRLPALRRLAMRLFRPLGGVQAIARPQRLVFALAVAFAIHAAVTLAAALSAAAYGIDASPRAWLAIVPVTVLATALPISINGWGVREGVMVALAAGQGIAPADALLVSVTLGAGNVIGSLPGAYLALRSPREAGRST